MPFRRRPHAPQLDRSRLVSEMIDDAQALAGAIVQAANCGDTAKRDRASFDLLTTCYQVVQLADQRGAR